MIFFLTLILNFILLLICVVEYIFDLFCKEHSKLSKILQLLTIAMTMITSIVLPVFETDAIQQNNPIPIIQS